MKFINDKKFLTLAIILLLFSISYFIVVNKISYAFVSDYNEDFYYDQVEKIIESSAKKYAEEYSAEFNDGVKYITVQKLIDLGYLIPDESGDIKDPSNENSTFNNRQIYIRKTDDGFEIKIEPESKI